MNRRVLADILNQVNEGIFILDDRFQILFWNDYMEQLTGIVKQEALLKNVFDVLPSLNRNYFVASLHRALEKDYKPFFSAAMHRGLITTTAELNVRVSSYKASRFKLLIVECIDVTSQYLRVNQLKEYVKKLEDLNKELQEKEKEIARLAYYDNLTGVANRTLFYNIAEKFLHHAKREQNKLGLMFIDLDNFKTINDTYGHKIGDRVLKEAAQVLTKSIRANDMVARFGGDEFILLLPGLREYSQYQSIVIRLVRALSSIPFDEGPIKISLSIGVSFFPHDGDTVDELITKADRAMYLAKSLGGNMCILYKDPQEGMKLEEHLLPS